MNWQGAVCCFSVRVLRERRRNVPILMSGWTAQTPLLLEVFYQVEDALDELPALYRIDWVDLNNVSPDFRESALLHTKVLYDSATAV